MPTTFYTLVYVGDRYWPAVEPRRPGKVKSYTKLQYAHSARTQAARQQDYRILETTIYADGIGRITTRWVD